MEVGTNDHLGRVIVECGLIEAKLTTLVAMWGSVDMPRNQLCNYHETSFQPTITQSVLLIAELLKHKSSVIERILNELLGFDRKLKGCAIGDLGKIVMCGLVSGMVLTQLLMKGENCAFMPESKYVNSHFFLDALSKSGWSFAINNAQLNRVSCQDIAKHALMVFESI